MKHRKLRIAFSATCGIICLLLIALWVRSYRVHDMIGGHLYVVGSFNISSRLGALAISPIERQQRFWHDTHSPLPTHLQPTAKALGFEIWWIPFDGIYTLRVPYSYLVLIVGAIAAFSLFKLPRRFSLRTLLIAITLIAVGLGLVVAFGG